MLDTGLKYQNAYNMQMTRKSCLCFSAVIILTFRPAKQIFACG